MSNQEKYSKLIEIWEQLTAAKSELELLGYDYNRSMVSSLTDSLECLNEELDVLFEKVLEEEE